MPTLTILDAVRNSIGSGLTNYPLDNKRAVMYLRSASNDAERAAIMRMILDARANWRAWQTVTQRQWQRNRRTVTERSCAIRRARWGNRHSADAILRAEREAVAMRESYVRCAR